MATARDIVSRAMIKANVVALGQPMTADEGAHGIDALNSMIQAWKLRGVDVGHTDLELDDQFALPPEFVEGTVYMLASTISPDFLRPPAFDADRWFRSIQAAYAHVEPVKMPNPLLRPPSRGRWTL
jgi:hypothetical protein